MECSLYTCKNQALDEITCETCYLPKYCSEACKSSDAESHSDSCRPHLYSLKDFVPVKDSQKTIATISYGEVQLVQKVNSRQLFALKIYRKSQVATMVPLKVLFREISLHKTLSHPNIIKLHDHLEDRIKVYLVLEYAEKGSLFDLIRKKIKLPEKEAWSIFTQTCLGLHYLHTKNLLHRDLKPENLLIAKNDVIKICDFGWSARGNEQRVTFCGTLDYMSPEVLNNQPQTFKIDIWALGILLYEMLHGTPPFRGKNPREMSRLIAEKRYNLGAHVSASAKELIALILQEQPEQRPDILSILKTAWVQRFNDSQLKTGYKVHHPSFGVGVIEEIEGMVCDVQFEDRKEQMIEAEIVREFSVEDETGQMLYEHSLSIKVSSAIDQEKANVRISPMYSKLGIGDQAGLKPSRSARNLRNSSNNHSPEHGNEPTIKNPKLPKSPKAIEEVKRSQHLPPRRNLKNDFSGINLSPETKPPTPGKRGGTPRSTFLMKFKNQN